LSQGPKKYSQIKQSRAKLEPNPAKEKAWIPLDRLRGIEPFQGVAPTPQANTIVFDPGPAPARPTRSVRLHLRGQAVDRENHGGMIAMFWNC
jgi:hypothetical protein